MKKILVVMVVLLTIGSAQAGVIFSDNFENVAPVAFPASAVDADPVAQVGTWSNLTEQDFYGHINDGIQVTNNAAPGPVGGSQYLANKRVTGGFEFAVASFSQQATSAMTVEFDFNLVGDALNPSYPYNMLSLYMQSASTYTGWTGEPISLDFRGNGWVRAYGSTQAWMNSEFARDQWVHVKLDIDFAAQKYDITLGNAPKESGFAFASATTGLGNLIFYAGAGDTTYYLDNVVVTPEPVSLALLGIGALILRARRRN